MTAKSLLATLGTAAGAVAIPAALFLGAGTAHADRSLGLMVSSAPGGVDVLVMSGANVAGEPLSGWCTYTATVQGNPIGKPAPALGVPFYLMPENDFRSAARLWFPSYPTGSTWNVTVTCPNGTENAQTVW